MGHVKVDAWLLSEEEAPRFRKDRETAAAAMEKALQKRYHHTARRFFGSEDGEAVVGLDESGEMQCLMHLDPGNVAAALRALGEGLFEEFITVALSD